MHNSAFGDAAKFVCEFMGSFRGRLCEVLDVGSCDVNGTLKPLINDPLWRYVGLDIAAGPNVDYVAESPYHWERINDNSFDVAVSSQCLEHVPEPWLLTPEIHRVVRPGGLLYCCAPNSWEYHAHPVDCYRYWPDGLSAVIRSGGFDVLRAYFEGPDTTVIARKQLC